MPFRERVKRAFRRRSSTDSPGSTKPKADKKKSKSKRGEEWEDWPEHIYKPHEMPRPKYRRPADPAHKEHLESYSWNSNTPPEEADRRRSHGSMYSPMGSRLPSRMGSIISKFGPSRGGSRAPSVLAEADEENDHGSAGLTRAQTKDSSRSRRRLSSRTFSQSRPGTSTAEHPPLVEHSSAERSKSETPKESLPNEADGSGADLEHAITATEEKGQRRRERAATVNDKPFDEEELNRALTNLTATRDKPSVVAAAAS